MFTHPNFVMSLKTTFPYIEVIMQCNNLFAFLFFLILKGRVGISLEISRVTGDSRYHGNYQSYFSGQ